MIGSSFLGLTEPGASGVLGLVGLILLLMFTEKGKLNDFSQFEELNTFTGDCLHLLEHLAELEEVCGPGVSVLVTGVGRGLSVWSTGWHLHWRSHTSQTLAGTGAPQAGLPGEGGEVPLLPGEADFSLELHVSREQELDWGQNSIILSTITAQYPGTLSSTGTRLTLGHHWATVSPQTNH